MSDQPNGVDLDAEIAALKAALAVLYKAKRWEYRRLPHVKSAKNARARERWLSEPEFRQRTLERAHKWRAANPERYAEINSNHYRKRRKVIAAEPHLDAAE